MCRILIVYGCLGTVLCDLGHSATGFKIVYKVSLKITYSKKHAFNHLFQIYFFIKYLNFKRSVNNAQVSNGSTTTMSDTAIIEQRTAVFNTADNR